MKGFFRKIGAVFMVFMLSNFLLKAQEIIPFNHYYLSPVFINPSYTGHTGFFELETNFRQQWTAIEGAPQTIRLSSQLPLGKHLAIGLIAINDQRALFNTNQANLNVAYTIYPGEEKSTNHRLSLGVGLGADVTFINNDFIDNPLDPALDGLANQSVNPLAQAGMQYQFNDLNVGFSLPFMLRSDVYNEEAYKNPQFDPMQATTTSINYTFNINHEVSFTPWILYQTYNNEFTDGYFQASGYFSYKNNIWLGGGYHSFNGLTFNIGFRLINKIRAGYAYEMSNDQSSQFGQGSQEFYLNFLSGTKDYLAELRPYKEELLVDEVQDEPKEEVATTISDSTEIVKNKIEESKTDEKLKEEKIEVAEIQEGLEKTIGQDSLRKKEPKNEQKPIASEPEPQTDNDPKPTFNKKLDEEIDNMAGIYVVVGAFSSKENANKYAEMAKEWGHQLSITYYGKTGYYYAIAQKTNNRALALEALRSVKSLNILDFNESWILEIK
jgi:type IX secretion system PorP/SprF family membrane protein